MLQYVVIKLLNTDLTTTPSSKKKTQQQLYTYFILLISAYSITVLIIQSPEQPFVILECICVITSQSSMVRKHTLCETFTYSCLELEGYELLFDYLHLYQQMFGEICFCLTFFAVLRLPCREMLLTSGAHQDQYHWFKI